MLRVPPSGSQLPREGGYASRLFSQARFIPKQSISEWSKSAAAKRLPNDFRATSVFAAGVVRASSGRLVSSLQPRRSATPGIWRPNGQDKTTSARLSTDSVFRRGRPAGARQAPHSGDRAKVAQLGRSARLANLGRGRANLREPGMDGDSVLEGWHLPDDTPVG